MHAYTADQWVLFFFFYCLCGWLWESCYVSLRKGQWVNRGFLNGPLLPIYGSGALIILLFTIPVKNDVRLIFLFGMLAATALEYVTGAVMERLFKVRYWDYSTQPCNLNGYICLTSSLAWGVFSILLVRFLHPPIEALLLRLPAPWAGPIALLLTAGFAVDAVQSVHDALDLRDVLTRLTEENEDLRRLAKRAEVFAAFAEEDLRAFRERTEVDKILLQNRLETDFAAHLQQRKQRKTRRHAALEEALRRRSEAKLQSLHAIAEALQAHEKWQELSGSAQAQRQIEVAEAMEKLRAREADIRSRTAKSYRSPLRILRANPSAKAKEFSEALESLRKLGDTKKH